MHVQRVRVLGGVTVEVVDVGGRYAGSSFMEWAVVVSVVVFGCMHRHIAHIQTHFMVVVDVLISFGLGEATECLFHLFP